MTTADSEMCYIITGITNIAGKAKEHQLVCDKLYGEVLTEFNLNSFIFLTTCCHRNLHSKQYIFRS